MRTRVLLPAVLVLCLWPAGARAAELSAGTAILQVAADQKDEVAAALTAAGRDPVRFRRLPFVAVAGTRLQLEAAAALPGVVAAHMDAPLDYDLNQSTPLIFEGAVAEARAAGLDGHGVNVAVVDSGVDGLHPDLRDRVVRNVKVLDVSEGEPTASDTS